MAMLSSIAVVLMTGGVAASVTNVGTYEREQMGRRLFALIGNGQPRPGSATTSGWRIQVGTFRSRGSALARLGATVRRVPELAAADAQTSSYGALTRARFAGLSDAASAEAMCVKVVAGGVGCFVLPPR